MSVIRGRRFAAVGAKETYTITRPTPTENTGLTTVLPTTEPGTSQIIVTVGSGDFYLPAGLVGQYVGVLLAQVLNNDATARTVSWRMLKNGSSVVANSASIPAANRYRVQGYFSPTAISGDNSGQGLVAGDVIELRLWAAASTNVQLVYWTYYLLDTRTRPRACQGLRDCTITAAASAYPTLASWPGGGAGTVSNSLYVLSDDTASTLSWTTSRSMTPKGLVLSAYGLIQVGQGDFSSNNTANTSSAASPAYNNATQLATITARRVPVV